MERNQTETGNVSTGMNVLPLAEIGRYIVPPGQGTITSSNLAFLRF
jgi:hypothetical protein